MVNFSCNQNHKTSVTLLENSVAISLFKRQKICKGFMLQKTKNWASNMPKLIKFYYNVFIPLLL